MKKFLYITAMASAIGLVSCHKPKELEEFVIQGAAQGSTYAVKFIAKEKVISKTQLDSVFTVIDNSMSTWVPTSLISKVNAGDSTVVVDAHFKNVMAETEAIYKESDGLFDPTVGTLMKLYGFGPKKKFVRLSEEEHDSVMNLIGWDKIKLDTEGHVIKEYPEMYMDFNAIAQGYTVDVVLDFLREKGITDAIVEVGGELAAMGTNTLKNKSWVVGIDDPLQSPDEPRKLIAKIYLNNLGMATSGNYRKVTVDSNTGEKFVHTMNPKTGTSQKGKLLSATVLASSTMRADGLATAFMAMDVEKSIEFIKRHPEIYVYFIYMDEQGEEQFYQSDNFAKLVIE